MSHVAGKRLQKYAPGKYDYNWAESESELTVKKKIFLFSYLKNESVKLQLLKDRHQLTIFKITRV